MAQQLRSTGSLRRAWRWDSRLPRPILFLLIVDLLLLLPIPFLLLHGLQRAPAPQGALAPVAPPPAPLQPVLAAPPRPAAQPSSGDARETTADLPLLIDPIRLQDASGYDTNRVAALLAVHSPSLASVQVDVGGGVQQSLASVITGQALRWNLNPAVVLSLVELQTRTLTEPISQPLRLDLGGPATAQGLPAQIEWLALELRAGLLEPIAAAVPLRDGTLWPVAAGIDQANYALLRFLALTRSRPQLERVLGAEADSWVAVASRVMGDPRAPTLVLVHDMPLLTQPFTGPLRPIARFDHQYPLVAQDDVMLGNDSVYTLGYDGHNGWDYQLAPQTAILAAATGHVLFAGWMDNGCATAAGVVVIEHSGGYRSSYWHLSRIDVAPGADVAQGAPLGLNGSTGCASAPHLHFSVQRLGRDVDPAGWCQPWPDPWAAHPAGAPSRWLWLDQADPCALNQQALIVDDGDPTAVLLQGAAWQPSRQGNFGSAHWAMCAEGCLARWRPSIALAQRYQLLVFVPNTATAAGTGVYRIEHADGVSAVHIDQAASAGSWVNLGTYRFLAGQSSQVTLVSAVSGQTVWADALAWVPTAQQP